MSDIQRYDMVEGLTCEDVDSIGPVSNGEYVRWEDYARLKAEVEALKLGSLLTAVDVLAFIRLKDEVERLRKSVMHSPAAQLKLKELEGKTTYEEINAAKDGKPHAERSPSFIEDLGNGVEKHDLLFRHPAKDGKPNE